MKSIEILETIPVSAQKGVEAPKHYEFAFISKEDQNQSLIGKAKRAKQRAFNGKGKLAKRAGTLTKNFAFNKMIGKEKTDSLNNFCTDTLKFA